MVRKAVSDIREAEDAIDKVPVDPVRLKLRLAEWKESITRGAQLLADAGAACMAVAGVFGENAAMILVDGEVRICRWTTAQTRLGDGQLCKMDRSRPGMVPPQHYYCFCHRAGTAR